MHPQETRAIQRPPQHAHLTVLAQRCEVMFRDGCAIGLHPVADSGHVQMFLRAVHHEGLRWCIFDLRQLATEIESDLNGLQQRDHPGAVFYTLRGIFPTRAAFGAALDKLATHTWWQHDAQAQEGLAA